MKKTNLQSNIIRILAICLLYPLSVGATNAMNIFSTKSPLTSPWRERFADVASLNKYTKNHPVEIADAAIENKNIDGAVINGGTFDNNDLNKISMKQSKLMHVVFRGGVIEHLDLSNSKLTDVLFEGVKLRGVLFYGATLNNVRFINCTFNGVAVDQTKESQIEVIDSQAISSSFSEGQLVAVFRNCKLFDGVEITDLQPPSSLTFEKSELSKVSMERSKLHNLVIDNSEIDTIFDVGSAENISVKRSVLDASFSATKIGALSISDTVIKNLSVLRATVKSASLTNCNDMNNFGMFQSTVGLIQFAHCKINDFRPIEAKIEHLNISDSSITNSTFEDMKAKNAKFDNVTFKGNVTFTNAHIDDLKTNNITKQPGLKLITDGSNVVL